MQPDSDIRRGAESVVRALLTAAKTLRLYPAASPIPLQAMQSAADAIRTALADRTVLPLVVARDGFTCCGERVGVTGAQDLADLLTSHGIAEVGFMPGCDTRAIGSFLAVVLRDPSDIQASGGPAAALALEGVEAITVSAVLLTTVSAEMPSGEDVDVFLRELAADEERLAAWLAATAAGDPAALADGLAEIARAAGPEGAERLRAALGAAYLRQDTGSRDAVVGLGLGSSDASPVVRDMMRALEPRDFASSVSEGLYAKNMLSMSNVLSSLPSPDALGAIIEELKPMLAEGGHTDRELGFLGHMLEVRSSPEPEQALAERQSDYRTVAALSQVRAEEIDQVHEELREAVGTVNTRTVNTLMSLLDQQRDFGLWSRTLSALAGLVPRLLAQGDIALADRVLADLSTRESRTLDPWPGLADQMLAALERATSPEAMRALVIATLDDPSIVIHARSILKNVSPAAQRRLVLEALGQRERDGLAAAEELLGRRLIDLLVSLVPELQWFQVGQVAQRLAREVDQRSRDSLEALARRSDDRSRQELAKALGYTSSASAVAVLSELARERVPEIAIHAIRSLGRTGAPGAARALGDALEGIDADNRDFPVAREIISALARTPDPHAGDILGKVVARRALIKRGHFAELQDLARRALSQRAGEAEADV